MFNILSAILYDEPFHFRGKKALVPPYSIAELQVANDLRKLDDDIAGPLEKEIRVLVREYRDRAFLAGARFGAQLTLELTEDLGSYEDA